MTSQLLLFLVAYLFGSYLIYRIVRKFRPNISFIQTLIPFWNTYLIIRVAVKNPVSYFWCMALIPIIGALTCIRMLSDISSLISAVLGARAFGLLAQKLDKRFWTFAIMAVIPVTGFIALCILAFDSSQPIAEDTTNNIITEKSIDETSPT